MTYDNNILYVDIDNLQHQMILNNNLSSKIRLYLGKIGEEEFEITVESIKLLPEEQQLIIRKYIKNIFNI